LCPPSRKAKNCAPEETERRETNSNEFYADNDKKKLCVSDDLVSLKRSIAPVCCSLLISVEKMPRTKHWKDKLKTAFVPQSDERSRAERWLAAQLAAQLTAQLTALCSDYTAR
jgi:hypothetical protein